MNVSRRRFLQVGGGAVAAAALPVGAASAQAATASAGTRLSVDLTRRTGRFNRNLFSVVGVTQDTGIKVDTWNELNPAGTQSRLGLDMNGMVPQQGVFDVDKMFLYMNNHDDAFFDQVVDAGMEPVILCAYDMTWLGVNGRSIDPPKDPQEWADVIAQVVEHFNGYPATGDYRLRVRYLEIWNEPNITQFWLGTPEQYFELFRTTARTIHERYPGVQVGGPAFSPGTEGYYDYGKAFIDAVGDDMDYFIYHSYGDDPPKIAADIELWRDYIAGHTHHRHPRLMVTEAEQFKDSDAVKVQNLIGRQFTLLDYADTMLGWHQFKLYEYKEGWYTFGMVYNDGSVFNRNYWPYWLFRDASGDTVSVGGGGGAGMHHVATVAHDRRSVNLVCWRDPETASGVETVDFEFLPDGLPFPRGILTVSEVGGISGSVVEARQVAKNGSPIRYSRAMAPGEALSLTLTEAAGAGGPWIGLAGSAPTVPVQGTFTATATVLNTGAGRVSGTVSLAGIPAGWTVSPSSGDPAFSLATGESTVTVWTVTATSATSGARAYHAQVAFDGGGSAHSIPVRIETAG